MAKTTMTFKEKYSNKRYTLKVHSGFDDKTLWIDDAGSETKHIDKDEIDFVHFNNRIIRISLRNGKSMYFRLERMHND